MNQELIHEKKQDTKRLFLYLAITFCITYIYEFFILWPTASELSAFSAVTVQLLVAAAMFFPALGTLLTRLLTKEGFKNSYIVPKNGKRSIPFFLFGWFGPAALTALGAAMYFLIFPEKYDPDFGYLSALLTASGVEATADILHMTVISQILSGVLLAPLLNFITCFGEEWGWRGYLLPKMQNKCGMLPLLLINGLIWGIWHMPLTIMGHNYGTDYAGYPLTGILAMCAFCIVMGAIFTYITIRTGSCLPAVLAHGSVNGFSSVGVLYTDGTGLNPFVGPAPTGIIGGFAFLICAVVMSVMLIRRPGLVGSSKQTENE